MDTFGVLVLASATAIGGGTLRDLILGCTPVFWVNDTTYLWVICFTCFITVFILRSPNRKLLNLLELSDAFGLAVFVAIGVDKSLALGVSGIVAVAMGVLTGCGGGIIRDVLARVVPMIFKEEIYASACMLGGSVHVICFNLGISSIYSMLAGIFVTLSIRISAIKWRLSLPIFSLD